MEKSSHNLSHNNRWQSARRGGWVGRASVLWTGDPPFEPSQILPVLSSPCRECKGPPCHIYSYTVYTPIGGKGRCHTRRDLQARKSAGEIHSGFETHEEGHTKSKTGAISGSAKWALVQQKKQKNNRWQSLNTKVGHLHLINHYSTQRLKCNRHDYLVTSQFPIINWTVGMS